MSKQKSGRRKGESHTRYNLRLGFTGFSMGLADLVPGVSGGTIALLYGIYDELLYSIKIVTGQVPKLLIKGKFKHAISIIPFEFLVPLAAGLLATVFGAVSLISFLLENYPTYIWSLFFGLVIGSSIVVSRRVSSWNFSRYVLMATGFMFVFWLVGLPALNAPATPLVLLGSGAIAISAMILPGISGSLILVLLGQYENVIYAVKNLKLDLIISFATGAAFGLALFSRLLSWLLREHHSATIAFLVGVMLGSLRKVWPWQTVSDHNFESYLPEPSIILIINFILMLVGFFLVIQLEKMGITEEHEDIDDRNFKKEIKSQHD